MKITIIVAGMNEPSNSYYLAQSFMQQLEKKSGCEAIMAPRLKDLTIEHFSLKHYDSAYQHEEDFIVLQKLIESSDGIVIATPVWNFGVPAHLKNFIDRMGSFALDANKTRGTLGGKPFFFIFTGGAPLPAWQGMMKKTTSFVAEGIRYFGGTPVGSYFEGKCTHGPGAFGLVVDKRPKSLEAIHNKADEFADIVKRHKETGQLPLAQNLWSQCMKIGEKLLKKVT